MILHDFTYEQIYDVMMSEAEKVQYRVNRLVDRFSKLSGTELAANPILTERYTIPSSGNTYVIWCRKDKRNDRYVKSAGSLILNDDKGRMLVFQLSRATVFRTLERGKEHEWRIEITTAHCLQRFRDRAGFPPNMSVDTIIAQWACNRSESMIINDMDKINPKYNRDNGMAIQTDWGIVLGTEKRCLSARYGQFVTLRLNTFVDNDKLYESQQECLINPELLYHLRKYAHKS